MTSTTAKLDDVSSSHRSAQDAVEVAVRLLSDVLEKPRLPTMNDETPLYLQMRRDLPYLIHATKDSATQILLNRNYKPLGNSSRTTEDWVDYEQCTNLHVHLSMSQIISICAPDRNGYLFGDGNPPWNGKRDARNYLKRVMLLQDAIAATVRREGQRGAAPDALR